MAELTAISIKMFDGTDFKSWSFEITLLSEVQHLLGIVDGTTKALDPIDGTECYVWMKPHGIGRSTILLAMEP
jgi:hypothetical protein